MSQPTRAAAAQSQAGPLAPYRVLDLTTERGWMSGKILADLGAQVLKVEPVGGDPGRHRGPFYQDRADPEHSLRWWFLNRGKRSITLNLETEDGRALFRRLLSQTDLLLESFAPGHLARLGIDHAQLMAEHPRLVWTSITPFGQLGPHARFQGPDLILTALCGSIFLTGDPDRAPVRVSVPQADLHGAAEGALNSLFALYHVSGGGSGQHVDVAAQLSATRALMNATPFPKLENKNLVRQGIWAESGGFKRRAIYGCKDGHVCIMLTGGVLGAQTIGALLEWAAADMTVPAILLDTDWKALDFGALIRNPEKAELFTLLSDFLLEFFMLHDKATLYAGALQRRVLLAPIGTVKDISADEQLIAREFFQQVEHPGIGEVRYPGPWAKLSQTPLPALSRAPTIGEHNEEVYCGRLGLDRQQLVRLAGAGVL